MLAPMRPRILQVPLLCLILWSLGGAGKMDARAEGGEEWKRQLRLVRQELERVRDSLHEAHRELAARAERIEALERALAAAKAASQTTELPAGPPEAARPSDPSQGEFIVAYERNSAANYEGREAALAEVRKRLQLDPETGLEIVGTANDSKHLEANRAVAFNRARYLADFLVSRGVPREAILSLRGDASEVEGKAGRIARIVFLKRGERPSEAGR